MKLKINEIAVLFLFIGFLLSCKEKEKPLPEVLVPAEIDLVDYFPYYEEVLSRRDLHLLSGSCPEFDVDSPSVSLLIEFDSIKPDEIACLIVMFSRILATENLEQAPTRPDGSRPIQTITRQALYEEYYQPKSDSWLFRIPNVLLEKGEYELSYGVLLKKDSLAKLLPFHKVECLYSVED